MKSLGDGNVVAIFDFDGTITLEDTFRDFFVWNFGRIRTFFAYLIFSPLIFLYIIGLVRNDVPKIFLFSLFFRGKDYSYFKKLCEDYSCNRLPSILNKCALQKIEWHKENLHTLVIVSASFAEWIEPWAIGQGFSFVIGANPNKDQSNILSGKFQRPCPYGVEKLRRLQEFGVNFEVDVTYVYGDSKGDKEILEVASYAFFKYF